MLPTLASPVCLAGSLTPIGSFFRIIIGVIALMLKKFSARARDHIMISWPELNHLNASVKNCYWHIDAIYQKLEKCSDENVNGALV